MAACAGCMLLAAGKGVHIDSIPHKTSKTYDHDVENLINIKEDVKRPITHSTHIVDLFDFESEESPPQDSRDKKDSFIPDEDQCSEKRQKWIEMQFQQNETRLYDIEYERGPLEDIKEEEVTDLDSGNSRIGSLGSQKESTGSIGSTKGSFGSTPDNFEVHPVKRNLKPADNDNLSISSLQEFEHLETIVALENIKKRSGGDQQSSSQDSSSNGSFPRRYKESRFSHGDDQSVSSVKDFEVLETACKEAHLMELKAREEEDLLDHESPENCFKLENLVRATLEIQSSTAGSFNTSTSGSDDYEKRVKEVDDIITKAQKTVHQIENSEYTSVQNTAQLSKSNSDTIIVALKECDSSPISLEKQNLLSQEAMVKTSADSLEESSEKKYSLMNQSSDSLELQKALQIASESSDSLNEIKDSTDEQKEIISNRRISSDSLEFSSQDLSDRSKAEQDETKKMELL